MTKCVSASEKLLAVRSCWQNKQKSLNVAKASDRIIIKSSPIQFLHTELAKNSWKLNTQMEKADFESKYNYNYSKYLKR